MPESNNGPTEDEREMMRWVKKEYGLEDEKPSDLMRWSLQARHAVLKRDVQIGELKAEIERLTTDNERLRKVVDAAKALDGRLFSAMAPMDSAWYVQALDLREALDRLEDS